MADEGFSFSWTDASARKNMAILTTGSKGDNRGVLILQKKGNQVLARES